MLRPVISVVTPVFNEQEVLREYYVRLSGVLTEVGGDSWEILLVNDGSSDGSGDVLRELCKKDARVKAIEFSRNFGQQIAITAGLDHATGEAVVIMDADLQDPPEVIKEMVRLWREGNDIVYGVREKRQGETVLKKATAALFYRLLGRISHVNVPVDVGDFRLLSRKAVDTLKGFRESNRFLRGLTSWIGFRQVGIQYVREARKGGDTKFGWARMIRFALDGITSFSFVPLRLATYLGFLVSTFAFLYAVYIIYVKLTRDWEFHGWAGLMVSMLFLGGVQLVSIGVIGEYIGRIYDEVKRRPLYVVRDFVNLQETPPPQKD